MTTVQDTVHSQGRSTFDVYFEIDCDCEELLDAIGIEYKEAEDDDTQNEVLIEMTPDEYADVFDTIQFAKINEQVIAQRILNYELAEYTTKVTIHTPSGDKICFS